LHPLEKVRFEIPFFAIHHLPLIFLMVESIIIPESLTSKKEKYESLLPQIKALVEGESDFIANVSNIVGALKQAMKFLWVGIYFVKGNELVLGPYQGPVACTRIGFGKGVCGTSWHNAETIIVKNVDEFPGHIACSTDSKSEIVVPLFKNKMVAGVIDADSDILAGFDETDAYFLKQVAEIIETLPK
jgi:L-methionine (R)-S-oxide reductase